MQPLLASGIEIAQYLQGKMSKGKRIIDSVPGGRVEEEIIPPHTVPGFYDEAALDAFAEEGRIAWADVENPSAWVDELRGYDKCEPDS